MSPRRRPLVLALTALVLAWGLALGGFAIAHHLKVTPEKINAFLTATDLSRLTPEQRRAALQKLAKMLNRLSLEERRAVRFGAAWDRWFQELEVAEKGELMELTLPTGFNQMLTAFEQLPPEKRRDAIENTVRRMREARERLAAEAPEEFAGDTNGPADLSPELRDKMVSLGVKTFMDQGSAETKAELQPVLEEMQQNMESGRLFRGRRRPRLEP